MQAGRRIGLLATVPATLREAARAHGMPGEAYPRLAEDLMAVKRHDGEALFSHRLAAEGDTLMPHVDAVPPTQFSMAATLAHQQTIASVPVLSAPHSCAGVLKACLATS